MPPIHRCKILAGIMAAVCVLGAGHGQAQEADDLSLYMKGLPTCVDTAKTFQEARACTGRFSKLCMETEPAGGTTFGTSRCTHAETEAWDVLLNREYKAAMATARVLDDEERVYFPGFAVRAEKLRDAQRAWIAFRDAQCALDYATGGSGSIRHIFGTTCFLQMTADRTLELRFLWDGLE